MRSGCVAVALLAMAAHANGVSEPTADLVASYSVAEVGIVFNLLYATHGGNDLIGSALYGVKVYRVQYATGLAGAGTPFADAGLTLSGLLILPDRPSSQLIAAAFIHGTTTLKAGVPSYAFAACSTNANTHTAMVNSTTYCLPNAEYGPAAVLGGMSAASMGFMGLVPDGIGYGASASQAPQYMMAEGYAVATFNLHAAATMLVPTLRKGTGVSSNLVVAGYSEGGYGALAVHKESSLTKWSEAGIVVVASFPSAGPYDLNMEFTNDLSNPSGVSRPAYLVYLGYAYASTLGLTVLNANYLTTIQGWYDGSNDGVTIDGLISSTFGDNGFLAAFDESVVADATAGNPTGFTDALNDNSLINGWTPRGSSTIHLCHATVDEVVAYANAKHLQSAMGTQGIQVSLKTIGQGNGCSSHTTCAPMCLSSTMSGMWAQEGKWRGALSNDNGVATVAIVAVVVAVGVVAGVGIMAWRRFRGGDAYEMIA
eukprot:m.183512 g.183512  ORF g.183512 m.183512 type:complete len:483 (-) comp15838_c0_seq1:3610-5058(-)